MIHKALIPALVIAAASVAVPSMAATAAPQRAPAIAQNHGAWQSISQRKYNLDQRIDVGMRNGSLSRREGTRLKAELNSLVRLERTYQRGGLTARERADLDQRYDRMAAQIRVERRDNDNRRR